MNDETFVIAERLIKHTDDENSAQGTFYVGSELCINQWNTRQQRVQVANLTASVSQH
jgi:hypothetical protein